VKFSTAPLLSFLVGLIIVPAVWLSPEVFAQSEITRLQNQIADRNDRLGQIEAEIAKFEAELQAVGAERQTLQQAINQLELERKKVTAEIARTENLISSTDLEINKLILELSRTERNIAETEAAIGEIIRARYKSHEDSLIEILLRHDRLSDFWVTYDAYDNVRDTLSAKVAELSQFQALLEENRSESEAKRDRLATLQTQYQNQNQVLTNNQVEQTELLVATKNEEANYQQLLAERQSAREQIMRELREFESQLQFILDPNTIPAPGTPVFNWPVENVVITQLFGGTEFAKRNANVYGGRPYHPGVDFGAPRGTPIFAPLTGTVRAVGNTDLVPGCFSWGKWILIDHSNGLSTLYAHQDVNSVSPGQKVSTGDIIGYVGNTGYSTGPHLHFTVYVQEAVSVRRFNEIKTVTGCGPATTPVAATDAYLDPMLYLPS
jgi:murein DD-endopeptidase MepM/ murein hydrolase activator NlpD